MLKTSLYVLAGIVLLAIGIVVFVAVKYSPSADGVLDFLAEHPERSAISLYRNGEPLAERGANRPMPLASTVKVIVAIEYAEQAAAGEINPAERITLSDVERFYVPDTDGGAHPAFLGAAAAQIEGGTLSVREIAKGMIRYSSNANTEWLAQRLGVERINARIKALGIEQHTPYYSIVGSLFVGNEATPGLKGEERAKALRALSDEEYMAAATEAGEKLAANPDFRHSLGSLDMQTQRVWSDRLPRSTATEYRALMQKINGRKAFSPEVNGHLTALLEGLMENPANQEWLKHAGTKGGSTAFVLTKASYATDKLGDTTALAYFFDDLGVLEGAALQLGLNGFELKILTDDEFRARVAAELGQ